MYEEYPMIDIKELIDLELLKTHIIYSDEYEELPKEKQKQIYGYCKLHATNKACLKNLEQIRYAVTRIYFRS